MGHGIKIVLVDKTKKKIVECLTTLYMSYNWRAMDKYWSVADKMHGKTVGEALASLKAADKVMADEKIPIGVPDPWNLDWSCGHGMSPSDKLSVFRYHLNNFVTTLGKLPAEAICSSDSCEDLGLINTSDESDLKEMPDDAPTFPGLQYMLTAAGPISSIVDPIKGIMKIQTTEEACYVAGTLLMRGDYVRARSWAAFAKFIGEYHAKNKTSIDKATHKPEDVDTKDLDMLGLVAESPYESDEGDDPLVCRPESGHDTDPDMPELVDDVPSGPTASDMLPALSSMAMDARKA